MGRTSQRGQAQRFRDNLRALIRHQGWTQQDAARHLGLSYTTIRKYLNDGLANVTELNRPRLQKICQRLGVTKIELLWASTLKPGHKPQRDSDAEAESWIYQLQKLLADEYRETLPVRRIRNAIESAFGSLILREETPKMGARGGSYVDQDTRKGVVRRNRRLGGGRKIKRNEDE